jgi:hypothetical protein
MEIKEYHILNLFLKKLSKEYIFNQKDNLILKMKFTFKV